MLFMHKEVVDGYFSITNPQPVLAKGVRDLLFCSFRRLNKHNYGVKSEPLHERAYSCVKVCNGNNKKAVIDRCILRAVGQKAREPAKRISGKEIVDGIKMDVSHLILWQSRGVER